MLENKILRSVDREIIRGRWCIWGKNHRNHIHYIPVGSPSQQKLPQ